MLESTVTPPEGANTFMNWGKLAVQPAKHWKSRVQLCH